MSQAADADYVLTILAPSLVAAHAFSEKLLIASGLACQGERILSDKAQDLPACLELHLRGAPDAGCRTTRHALATSSAVDFAIQPGALFRRRRGLIAFDMDSTLIQNEVIDELARVAGVLDEVAALTKAALNDQLPFQESLTKRVSLLAGLPVAKFQEVSDRLRLSAGAERLFQIVHSLGMHSAIFSGGFRHFAEPFRAQLGIDVLHAHDLEIANGHLTGRIQGAVSDGARKKKLLLEMAAQSGLDLTQTIVVGDGANDIPMLTSAGLGIAFRAKPVVRQSVDCVLDHYGLDSIPFLFGLSLDEQQKISS